MDDLTKSFEMDVRLRPFALHAWGAGCAESFETYLAGTQRDTRDATWLLYARDWLESAGYETVIAPLESLTRLQKFAATWLIRAWPKVRALDARSLRHG